MGKNLLKLVCLWFILGLITGCGSKKRETVLDRYPSGAKHVVGVYKGTGSNEVFLKRKIYQPNGRIGKIKNMVTDSTITYLELHPETKSAKGLEDYLQGSWNRILKINNNKYDAFDYKYDAFDYKYDVFESYLLTFNENNLTRNIQVTLCNESGIYNEGHENGIYNGASFHVKVKSKMEYKDSLELNERDIHIINSSPFVEWTKFLNKVPLYPEDFSIHIFIGQAKTSKNIKKNSIPGKLISLDKILILPSTIGNSFIPIIRANIKSNDDEITKYERAKHLSLLHSWHLFHKISDYGGYPDCKWLKKNYKE